MSSKTEVKQEASPKAGALLILSFIEGASVMVAELAGGKMLAPFYGTSLYVWASTLAITLGGLTLGYYLGGRLSERSLTDRKRILFVTLSVASALVIIMPVWANYVMTRTLDMEFLTGLVVSQLSFLLLPVMGMGMVSPLIIGLIGETRNSGSAAGSVYAISTFGGILATLLTGFWLVPVVGISIPCMVVGALLLLASLVILNPRQKLPALLLLALLPSAMYVKSMQEQYSGKYNLLYYSEGILGQIKIVDFQLQKNGKTITSRNLLVNHNWQTWINKDDPSFSFLFYTRFSRAVISSLPPGSNALLVGLGGGTVARQLEERNIAYDAVEIDGRLPELAKQYFGLKGKGNLVVDDGRHFINKTKAKYDLVIIDALLGENVPSHLLSIECFETIKKLMNPTGKIFIEFDGIEEGESGKAQKMLLNTIVKAGFQCQTLTSVPNAQDGDIMFLASQTEDTSVYNALVTKDDFYVDEGRLGGFKTTLQNETTEILTDNNPALDYLLKARMAFVRNDLLRKANKAFLENDLFFYY